MKNFTKFLSLFLALLMLAAIFVSCGESAKPADTEEPVAETSASVIQTAEEESTEPAETEPAFPVANYEGADFVVYARGGGANNYGHVYIYAEEQNGDVMNDSTLERNQRLQEKYNVKIVVDESASNPSLNIQRDIAAGQVSYDVVLDQRYKIASVVTQGILYDVNQLNVDFSSEWWDINVINDLKINGKNYMFANDVSTSNLACAQFFFFNKQIVIDYKLEDPYELVKNNEWTLDKYIEMVRGVSDIKADGSLGTYGMITRTGTEGIPVQMFVGCGIKFAVVNSEGELTCNIEDNMDKLQTISEKLKTVLEGDTYGLSYDTIQQYNTTNENKWNFARYMFAEGHFLFTHCGMGGTDNFIDMTDEYGVLPNPKYDSEQESYYHRTDKCNILFCIPNDESVDKERIALIMDYWGYLSSKTVMPAYYDITIRSKRINDTNASNNLDIIKHSMVYELSDLFCASIIDCVDMGYSYGSFPTAYKKMSTAIKAQLKTINKAFAEE